MVPTRRQLVATTARKRVRVRVSTDPSAVLQRTFQGGNQKSHTAPSNRRVFYMSHSVRRPPGNEESQRMDTEVVQPTEAGNNSPREGLLFEHSRHS